MLSVDFIAEKLHILLFSEIPVAWSHRKSILLFVYWCFDVKSTYRRKRLSDYWRGSRGLVPQSPPSLPLMERWVKDQGVGEGGLVRKRKERFGASISSFTSSDGKVSKGPRGLGKGFDFWRGSRGLEPPSPPSLRLMERCVKDPEGGGRLLKRK